jgi:hypothetical protein
MCGCFDICVGVLVMSVSILCFVLFVLCFCIVSFMYIHSCFVCTSVRTTATE